MFCVDEEKSIMNKIPVILGTLVVITITSALFIIMQGLNKATMVKESYETIVLIIL